MLGTVRLAHAGIGAARTHLCVGRVRALSQSQSQRPRSRIQLAGRRSDYRTAHSWTGASKDAAWQQKPSRQPWQKEPYRQPWQRPQPKPWEQQFKPWQRPQSKPWEQQFKPWQRPQSKPWEQQSKPWQRPQSKPWQQQSKPWQRPQSNQRVQPQSKPRQKFEELSEGKPRQKSEGLSEEPDHVDQPGRLLKVTFNPSSITLFFENHICSHLSRLWFRDACPCAHCVSKSSGQKKFATCDIDATPELKSCKVLEDGSLELVWARDFMGGGSHTSVYPPFFVQRFLMHNHLLVNHRPERYLWDRAAFERNMAERTISYDAWMAGGEPFAKGLMNLAQWGLIVIKGVPETRDAVKDIANRIGILQSTFYGETWDVISKPDAENVAYTNEFLCLHQDLLYYRDSPHVQLLHCMSNDCEGGDSLFSDGLRAGAELKYQRPQDFDLLKRQRVNFQYSRNGHFYQQGKAVIHEGRDLNVLPQMINWSPPFQGMFSSKVPEDEAMAGWRDAAKAFKDSLESPENMLQYRMQPGDCILFDNSRILHGRTKFDTSSGHRHLHGAYLQRQTFMSALQREFGDDKITTPKISAQREVKQAIKLYGEGDGEGDGEVAGEDDWEA